MKGIKMYDFIGDIHGHADKLEQLLEKLDYQQKDGVYGHPTRKAFFLGDFIDRGPKVKQVLQIVRPMVEKGFAKSVMANHEFNLICFMHKDHDNNFLRERSIKNIKQILTTLSDLNEEELEDYCNWFLTLPLWHEEEKVRIVHACWNQSEIEVLKKYTHDAKLDLNILKTEYPKKADFYNATEIILKGPEQKLPPGKSFKDKDNNIRENERVIWWKSESFYPPEAKPVFFGHYWLKSDRPYITAPNAQCLDFSVAKDGHLVAYRFDGESSLVEEKLVFV